MNIFRSIITGLILLVPSLGFSQKDSLQSSFLNYLEVGGLYSTIQRTPFWLQANQFGTVPRTGSAAIFKGGFEKGWLLGKQTHNDQISSWRNKVLVPNKNWKAKIGGEAVANVSDPAMLQLPQLYGTVSYGNWEIMVGRKKQWIGLADSTLGTGSYIWSGNALPIPKIQLGLTKFTEIPFTDGWLSILGFYSDGLFEGVRPITSQLRLHQKQLYGQLGRPDSFLNLYAGFNHQVQWGGRSPYETVNGQMPNGFKNYLTMIFGGSRVDSVNAVYFDNGNRIGNHLGTIDVALELKAKNTKWLFYRQNIYDDGSLYRLTNIKDGLNGIKITRSKSTTATIQLKDAVLEFLYTKSQGGSIFILNQKIFGKDNYFNHAQVRDGWSYYDRTIGTPFIPPTSQTIWKFPNYGNAFTSNNRVWVLHTGLRGTFLNKYEWTTKLSYSSNAGVYDQPFPTTVYQFSGLLSVQTKTDLMGGNTIIKASLATDRGGLYPNSTGIMVSLRKEGLF